MRKQLANGIRAAFLPKKTRGGRVVASLTLHWGDEKSLTNREAACSFAGSMLMRGTRKKSRAELQDAFDKLNASVSIGGDGASVEVRRENLAAALRLVAEALREPAFPHARVRGDEARRADRRRGAARRPVGARRRAPLAPPAGLSRAATRTTRRPSTSASAGCARRRSKDAVACYRELFGATGADFVAVGDFDPDELAQAGRGAVRRLEDAAPVRARAGALLRPPGASSDDLLTPDKANAVLRGGLNLQMRDDHPDFPALVLANHLLGGSSTARVPARVREKEGLSYSTYTSFSSSAVRRVGVVPRLGDLRAAEPRARRDRDPRGAGARAARRLQRRGGRSGQEVAARGAAPVAHAGPRARRPARRLPLRQAHLRLGHRLRDAHRRAHPGRR